jgi:Ca2+-binding RTX toxin-like protein
LDKFVFNSVAERGDIFSDFAVIDDVIQVKASAFGDLAKGTLSAAAFFANTSGQAHDASDRFIYETDVDKLWYDSNGNATGGRVLLADLNDVAFTRLDIQII